jgi:hypothetical protein
MALIFPKLSSRSTEAVPAVWAGTFEAFGRPPVTLTGNGA